MAKEGKPEITLADSVENRLLEYLRVNHLHFGDLLPKETELAGRLQISRHIVREGLSRLKALGLLEAKKRRGTVLCHPKPFAGFQKLADANLFTERDRRNFMELRVAMELGMCGFIYARRSPEKLAVLRKAAGESGSPVRRISAEVDFHSALMAFAENPAANDFRKVLMLAFGSIRKNAAVPAILPPSHKDICDVLETGSADDFHEVMQQHFQPYLSSI